MPWYAIYTKPRWEKKVHQLLLQKGIESYCPLNKVLKQWSDRKKVVEVPLFASYLFVNIAIEKQTDVRMTAGVVNFVYWLNKPAVINNTEMQALKDFVDVNENIMVQPIGLKEGDSVELDKGIFKGQKAVVQKISKHKVELILESLQVKLVVGVELVN